MFSALKNPKENKEKEKEWNKIITGMEKDIYCHRKLNRCFFPY